MKANIAFISFLFCCFCSKGQELEPKDFESFYKVLVFQTDQAIDAKKYDYATIYENSYRYARQHPLNDSIDNTNTDMYFSAIQLNKENDKLFPGFVIQLDEEPEEQQMNYVVHHMVIDSNRFADEVTVSTPGYKTVQDFDLFLTDMIEKDYYILYEDYKTLMEIKKKIETFGVKYSPRVVRQIKGNRVKIVDPLNINPLIKATPVNKEFRTIQK